MTENRMLIVPAELTQKIDENRGDLSRSDFIEFLIDSQLSQSEKDKGPSTQYVTKEEVKALEQDVKKLLKSFLDFFLNYGLEVGKQSSESEVGEMVSKLKELEKDTGQSERGKATIKWK